MSLAFSEEFETTTAAPPVGWTVEGGTPFVTSSGYHANGCQIINANIRKAIGSHLNSATNFFVFNGPGRFIALQHDGAGTASSDYTTIFTVQAGQDDEIVVTDGAARIICQGNASAHFRGYENQWTFIQVDSDVSTTLIGTLSGLQVGATVRLNGELICTGTTSFLSSLPAYYDTLRLSGSVVDSKVDSIYLYDSILSTPIVTPNQGTAIHARVSQAILEYAGLPASIDARISQAVIEHADLPFDPNVRISQAVIELILLQQGSWRVYEA